MTNVIWNLMAFLVAVSILITIHEFGHYLIAKYYGVVIKRFSIGFGKVICKYSTLQGTEFVISLIPLGGYVKMLDERLEPVTPEMRLCAFNNKSISKRAAIIIAGPVANFIFAIFSYWLVFITGLPVVKPVISEVIPNSIAANAQIMSGMEIKTVNGIKTPDWDSVKLQFLNKIGSNNLTIGVTSLESDQKQDKILNIKHWSFNPDKEDIMTSLGIISNINHIDFVVTKIQANSAANKAGLQVGDRLIKVNGKPLTKWITFVNLVRNNPGKLLKLEVERQGNLLFLTLIPDTLLNSVKAEGFVGIVPKVISTLDKHKILRKYGLFSAIYESINKTWNLIKLNLKLFAKLIIGEIKLNSLGGPISLAQGAGISAKFGLIHYLMFLAFISINLGIVNLFPFPILDGGHLIFLIVEKFQGKSLSKRIQDITNGISSVVLLLLMGIAIFNDLYRLIEKLFNNSMLY